MKTAVILFLLMVFFAFSVNAQVQRHSNPVQSVATTTDKKKQKHEMMESLNLSKQQMAELKDFHRAQKQKKDEIISDQSLNESERRDKLRALRMEQKEKLNSLLTPEQKEKLKQERMNKADSTDAIK